MRKLVTVDEKGRIMLSRELRKNMKIKPRQHLWVNIERKNIIIQKIPEPRNKKGADLLIKAIKKPAHVNPKKLKELDIEKIEEEAWTS